MSCVSLDIKSTLTALFYWLCVKRTEGPWRRRTHRQRLLQQTCPEKEKKRKRDDLGNKMCSVCPPHCRWNLICCYIWTWQCCLPCYWLRPNPGLTLKLNHCGTTPAEKEPDFFWAEVVVLVVLEGLQLRLHPPAHNNLLWLTGSDGQMHTRVLNTRPQEPPAASSHDMMRWGVGMLWGGRGDVETLKCHAVSDNWTMLLKRCFNKIKGRLRAFGGRLLCRTRTWMIRWLRFIVQHQKQHTSHSGCTALD